MTTPRGTRDFLPPESERFAHLERVASEIFERAGYRRIMTPMFEATEVFQRGIGEATDIVTKEMYTFADRSGNSLTLRPEGTAPVVRAVVTNHLWEKGLPVKLYYAAPMFRYERPQKGRMRQHHQLGIEAIGSENPAIDAEVIETGRAVLEAAGVGEVSLLLNSMGHPGEECRLRYLPALREFLGRHAEHLDADCRRRMEVNPLRVFDCKVPGDQQILAEAPVLESFLCEGCRDHLAAVQGSLKDAGIEYRMAPRLVRGFDYYTRTTFEYQSGALEAAQNALGGGGRYDGLVAELGGPELPGIGFGLGIERILLAQEAAGTARAPYVLECYVVPLTEAEVPLVVRLARSLRAAGVSADFESSPRKVGDHIRRANRREARFVAIIGPEEREQGSVTLRDLAAGRQEAVPLDRVPVSVKEGRSP